MSSDNNLSSVLYNSSGSPIDTVQMYEIHQPGTLRTDMHIYQYLIVIK